MAKRNDTHPAIRSETPEDSEEQNDLDDLIAEIAQQHPEFPAMVEAALQERRTLRERGIDPNDMPPSNGLEQQETAAPMPTGPDGQD
jgi:hypothetical protein